MVDEGSSINESSAALFGNAGSARDLHHKRL
jgi:hypothetical protein